MNAYWLGYAAGAATILSLAILATIAIRTAERSTPMAAGHWPADDTEDDIDRELRNLTSRDAA